MPEIKEAPKPKTDNGQGQAKTVAPQSPSTPAKTNGNPFTFLRRFAEQMDHLLEDFGLETGVHMPSFLTRGHELLRHESGLVQADWSPKVDVFEREGLFGVRADLPGLSKDDIKVEITNDLLTIQGERREERKEEREGRCYSECSYGSFYRTVPLPEGADSSKATAEFHNGVLEVAMPAPKLSASKARQLEVKQGK